MKFFFALTALALGVAGQSSSAVPSGDNEDSGECRAGYIVDRCLETEMPKAKECSSTDLDCLCAAYDNIATCYNNCPKDSRASSARSQANSFCAQVKPTTSLTATASVTAAATASTDVEEEATSTVDRPTNTRGFDIDTPSSTAGAADGFGKSAGGMLLGVAGFAALVV